jgi:glyoxylase-like metal-dependent hydrolase (beta-lactamase superfamily II)
LGVDFLIENKPKYSIQPSGGEMMHANRLSRRSFLQGLSAGAAGLAFGGGLAGAFGAAGKVRAQTAPSLATATAFYRFALGEAQVTIIQDGTGAFPSTFFGANAPEGATDALLAASNLPAGLVNVTLNIMLVENAGRRVLIDGGQAGISLDGSPSNSGKLPATLEVLGIMPTDITDVIISHAHPDHIFGVGDTSGPFFPNAAYYIAQSEYDFAKGAPYGSPLDGFLEAAKGILDGLTSQDQLMFFDSDDEVVPGIQAVAAVGHTPGHHAFLVSSNDQRILNLIDTANNSIISLAHPEWAFVFDADPVQASETRRALLQRAADEQLFVFGYHFPFPGVGVIAPDGEGFRFISA